jgi:hypothetical protein
MNSSIFSCPIGCILPEPKGGFTPPILERRFKKPFIKGWEFKISLNSGGLIL